MPVPTGRNDRKKKRSSGGKSLSAVDQQMLYRMIMGHLGSGVQDSNNITNQVRQLYEVLLYALIRLIRRYSFLLHEDRIKNRAADTNSNYPQRNRYLDLLAHPLIDPMLSQHFHPNEH